MGWKDTVKSALEYNPTKHVLQNIIDPSQAAENFASSLEDPVSAAMAGGGVGAAGMMVGPRAAGWKGLRQFSSLYDKMPKAEISDELAQLSPGIKSRMNKIRMGGSPVSPDVPLQAIMKHPELYSQYPDLENMLVKFGEDPNNVRGAALRGASDSPPSIQLNLKNIKNPLSGELDSSGALDTLLHELQHHIQFKEGFAEGSSPTAYSKIQQANLKNAKNLPMDKLVKLDTTPYELYRRTAGEIEARDTAQRGSMTEDERMWGGPKVTQVTPSLGTYETRNMPYESQNIPIKQWEDPKKYLKDVTSSYDVPQSPEDMVKSLGFKYNGKSEAFKNVPEMHWFTDPVTGGTHTLPVDEFNQENLINKINENRVKFKKPLFGQEEAPQSLAEGGKPTPRNYQIDPETQGHFDSFLNDNLDLIPKAKEPLPNIGG